MLTTGSYADLRFSPDGTKLVAVSSRGLVSIDVLTGAETLVLYTNNGILSPDWSPDMTRVVYARVGKTLEEPSDSAGLHFVDLTTGADSTIRDSDGEPILGDWPMWSPEESLIVFSGNRGVQTWNLRTRELSTVATIASAYMGNPQWIEAGRRIVYNELGETARTFVVDVHARQIVQWPVYLGFFRAISPRDSCFAFRSPQPGSGSRAIYVLSTRRLDDGWGTSSRLLTTYEPDTTGLAVSLQP
jgi:Tol biopolymer transport system component